MPPVDIIVARAPADRSGDDIVSGLLVTLELAVQRGLAEIETSAGKFSCTAEVLFRPGLRNGQLVRIYDSEAGYAITAKVVGITHTSSESTLLTELTLERPDDT